MKELEQKGYYSYMDGTKSTDPINAKQTKIGKDIVKPKRQITSLNFGFYLEIYQK